MEQTESEKGTNVVNGPKMTHIPHPGGLGCAIFEKMWENQDRVAQIDGITGEKETFNSILIKSIRTAIKIRSKDVKKKDTITICAAPNTDICVPYVASIFVGVIPTTLDPSLSVDEMVHLIKQVKPKIVFVGPEAEDKMGKALEEASLSAEVVVFGETSTHVPFSEYLQSQPEEDDFKPVVVESLKETALVVFSSGTSGSPKGICLSHASLLIQCHRVGDIQPSYRTLTFGSFYWMSTICFLLGSMLQGFCRIVVPKFDLQSFWRLLEESRPNVLFLSPSLVVAILRLGRPSSITKLPLKEVYVSGGSISEKHMREFKNMVPEAIVTLAYAQTELAGPGLIFKTHRPDEVLLLKNKPLSSGTVVPGFSMKVVDVDTEETLGPNQRGELRVKSKCVMSGYYNNLSSSDAFDADGWLRTGDIAYYDENLCFFIVDRFKEVFKYRGYQIVPAPLESVLVQHPAVETAVVFGIPHEEDGDHPTAVVVLSKDAKGVSSEEIAKFVEDKVSDAQKLRGGVKIVDSIPLSITGKIKRRELRDKVMRGEL